MELTRRFRSLSLCPLSVRRYFFRFFGNIPLIFTWGHLQRSTLREVLSFRRDPPKLWSWFEHNTVALFILNCGSASRREILPCQGHPQWGAVDAEIKVPSDENTELKGSPFKAWSRSVHSHTCYAYCQRVLLWLFLHFQSIHLHFFQNFSQFFLLALANTWFLCRPAE